MGCHTGCLDMSAAASDEEEEGGVLCGDRKAGLKEGWHEALQGPSQA